MEDEENELLESLGNRTYRSLQQMAKSMGLPSNFKKLYLIQLIAAKRFGKETEISTIIQHAKRERLEASKARRESKKRRMKISELLETSPPITSTPKRPKPSPEIRKSLIFKSKRNTAQNIPSDRILRSFNMKMKPNYALLNGDDVRKELKIKIITSFPQVNPATTCVKRPVNTRQLMLTQGLDLRNPSPSNRERVPSGIYPLVPRKPLSVHMERVVLRKIDGSLTEINALVQKRIAVAPNKHITEMNVQVNKIDTNIPSSDGNLQKNGTDEIDTLNESIKNSSYQLYYHKKIRAEQIRYQKLDDRLPKISDVFSQFNNHYKTDYSQPLFVQVSTEAEISSNHPIHINQPATVVLEQYYNFKSTHNPLLQIATTSNTKCVYTVPTVTTPVAQPSTIVSNEAFLPSLEVCNRNQVEAEPRVYEFQTYPDQNVLKRNMTCEDFNTSLSPQNQDACSIPEMVEDALEIISQDGDYMEQIEMDNELMGVRVQCVLCSWAGPKIVLEYHIKKEHNDQIHKYIKNEWSLTYTLGDLVRSSLWRSLLIEHEGVLYVLSAKYQDPDCFMASLASLSSESTQRFGSITIYNKVSGEPLSWTGHIQALSNDLPYENKADCLKTELSRLDLLPNSANLKLINRELVCDSPTKVVVGQPVLNDIHLILFVRLFN